MVRGQAGSITYIRNVYVSNNLHPPLDLKKGRGTLYVLVVYGGFLESLYRGLGNGVGCLVDSPRVERDRCYVNTNLLGARALRVCGSGLAARVEAFAARFRGLRLCRYRVLWREPTLYAPRR